jgi:hypothetical protein
MSYTADPRVTIKFSIISKSQKLISANLRNTYQVDEKISTHLKLSAATSDSVEVIQAYFISRWVFIVAAIAW